MGVFGKLFSKTIRVKENDLQKYFCVKHKKSGKKIYLNTNLEVPENCTCTFCYRNKPCETLNAGQYQLNGNSLPMLYKKGNFNKPNKRNYIPGYFFANIWFASKNNKWIEFDIDKFVIKDKTYGKQKICLSMKVNLSIDDAGKFFKSLLYDRPHISSKRVLNAIIKWIQIDVRKFLKRQCYNIDDFMCYTRGFNEELHNLLCDRFTPMGINIVETDLDDVIMGDELVREITDNRRLSFQVHSNMQDFDIMMNSDGVKSGINFERSAEQLQGSVAEKYMTKSQDKNSELRMDAIDEGGMVAQNQNAKNFTTNRFGEICDGINLMENNQIFNDIHNKENGRDVLRDGEIDMNQSNQLNESDANLNAKVNDANLSYNDFNENNHNSNFFGGFGDIVPNRDADSEAMYDMANETMSGEVASNAYNTLYGKSTGYKICTKCNRQVPIYASFCPYCGNGDLKHDL